MTRPLVLAGLLWPTDQLGTALAAVAGAAGLAGRRSMSGGPSVDSRTAGVADPDFGVVGAGSLHGVEIEIDPVEIPWRDLERVLPRLGPAVVTAGEPVAGHLALLQRRGGRVVLLTPDGSRHRLSAARVAAAILGAAEARHVVSAGAILAGLPLSTRGRRRAQSALAAAQLDAAPGATVHVLAASAGSARAGLLAYRLGPPAMAFLAAVAASQAIVLLSWYLLGRGLLRGGLQGSWLVAWGLLIVSLPSARASELAAAAGLGQRAALTLRRRLSACLLSLGPGGLRGDGTGRLIGRVLAGESLERALLGGAPAALVTLLELAGAIAALAHGAAATAHLILLMIVVAAAGFLFGCHAHAHQAYGECRLDLTDQLVEGMAGHRTRLARGTSAIDPRDDARLAGYLELSQRLGRWETLLRAALPRAWWIAGLAALAPGLGTAGAAAGRLAASLGGLLLAQAALGRLGSALCDLGGARTAAREVRPILAAGTSRPGQIEFPGGALPRADDRSAQAAAPSAGVPRGIAAAPRLLEARDLVLELPGLRPILAGACLDIRSGDRIVLDGASGAGKSTLAAVLAAQRPADAGLLLLGGLDQATLGHRAWRRRVVAVPQLHTNQLFADTLAFNLLVGRAWPPSARDLADADALCRELGLGRLLDRLPAGLDQRVGEAGWQLSDGERSRVCLARAMLQDCDLVIFDECLAALDPESRIEVLGVASRHANALLLIAHQEPLWTEGPRRDLRHPEKGAATSGEPVAR